jgi:hypothetical protein
MQQALCQQADNSRPRVALLLHRIEQACGIARPKIQHFGGRL